MAKLKQLPSARELASIGESDDYCRQSVAQLLMVRGYYPDGVRVNVSKLEAIYELSVRQLDF